MGLRDDIRNALGSLATAIPDAAHSLRHGDGERGLATQSSSREYAEVVSEEAPAEVARYVVNAALFPTLEEGAAVELGGSLRVVVSMKADPIGATYTLGLSAEFEKQPAAYYGARREGATVRRLAFPLDVLTAENGVAGNHSAAIAPTYSTSYTVAIRREDWRETTDPEPSDKLTIHPGGIEVVLKVSTVTRHGGWYILKCRTRE